MGSKGIVILAFFWLWLLLISSKVLAARELAETSTAIDKSKEDENTFVYGARNPGGYYKRPCNYKNSCRQPGKGGGKLGGHPVPPPSRYRTPASRACNYTTCSRGFGYPVPPPQHILCASPQLRCSTYAGEKMDAEAGEKMDAEVQAEPHN